MEQNTKTVLILGGLGAAAYLLFRGSDAPAASSTKTGCPKCPPLTSCDDGLGCEAGGMDAALTIRDFKKKNSTWIPSMIPQVLAKLNLLSVQARNDNYSDAASAAWKQGYRRCFQSTLTTFGLGIDEDGKVSA